MGSYSTGLEVVQALTEAGADATTDPRSATPPCIVVTPPRLTFDVGCGATAAWSVWAIVPGPANADAWQALDELLGFVRKAKLTPVERVSFVQYSVASDAPPLPAYRIEFTSGVDA